MRVQNISTVPVVVAGLTILPRRIGTIPDADWKAWQSFSTGNKAVATSKLKVLPAAEPEPTIEIEVEQTSDSTEKLPEDAPTDKGGKGGKKR